MLSRLQVLPWVLFCFRSNYSQLHNHCLTLSMQHGYLRQSFHRFWAVTERSLTFLSLSWLPQLLQLLSFSCQMGSQPSVFREKLSVT